MFPNDIKCMFCDTDIPNFDEKPYCDECEKSVAFNRGHRCAICDQPIFSEADVCDFCQKQKRTFDKIFCPFLYEDAVKNAILAFKDSNQRYRANAFAKVIVSYMGKTAKDINVISYIPMTSAKQKQRGFNQSQLLAEEIGKILQVPVLNLFEKVKEGSAQKSLTFKERLANIEGSLVLKKSKLSKTETLLLVDDIVTTCATVSYASGLVRSKVNKIYVCAIAREYIRPTISDPHIFENKKIKNGQKKQKI